MNEAETRAEQIAMRSKPPVRGVVDGSRARREVIAPGRLQRRGATHERHAGGAGEPIAGVFQHVGQRRAQDVRPIAGVARPACRVAVPGAPARGERSEFGALPPGRLG